MGEIKIQWTVCNDFSKLPARDKTYFGRVYAIEFQDGTVKIGSSKSCKSRATSLVNYIGFYGKNPAIRIAYTNPHVNYRENERCLHELFSKYKDRAKELFRISFSDIISVEMTGETSTEKQELKVDRFLSFGKELFSPDSRFNKTNSLKYYLEKSLSSPDFMIELIKEEMSKAQKKLAMLKICLDCLYDIKEKPEARKIVANDNDLLNEIVKKAINPNFADDLKSCVENNVSSGVVSINHGGVMK